MNINQYYVDHLEYTHSILSPPTIFPLPSPVDTKQPSIASAMAKSSAAQGKKKPLVISDSDSDNDDFTVETSAAIKGLLAFQVVHPYWPVFMLGIE